MKPFDPALVRSEPAVRRPLGALGVLGVVQGALAIAQAIVVAGLVVAVVDGHHLLGPVVAVLVVFVVRGVVSGAAERVAAWAGSCVSRVLRRRAVEGWLARPVDERPSETVMLSRSTLGAEAVEPYVARYLPALVAAAVVPALALVALALTDWVSALIVVLTVPLLPVFAALIGMHTKAETAARWDETDRLTGHFLDVMRGLPTLVNYQRAEHQVGVVRAVGEKLRRATVRTLRTAFLSSAALELLATISVAIVAVSVGLRLVHGEVSLHVGLIAILLAPEAYWPIRRVGQEFHAAADGAQAIAELREQATPFEHTPISGDLLAAGVSYRYPGTDTMVVRDLDVARRTGLTVLVGESGAGKTTVLDLLAGLRAPTAGVVHDAGVHYAMQRPFLLPGTLADNLALGTQLPAGTRWLPEPLRRLPAGLETPIGDDGFGLSAGQRALLALTRARLSSAPVVLLDEPTAHLDPQMQELAESLILDLAAERAVVVATHSDSLIALAENVIRLDPVGPEPAAPRPAAVRRGTSAPTSLPVDPVPTEPHTTTSVWRPAPGVLRAAVVGALASTCGVALTATSGWLIVQASTRPPVLTLLVAIVCVRAFGIGRPVLRYVERILSHDAALGDLVSRRATLYERLIPLTPARLGRRRRADVLTAAVADLDDEVDLQVRSLVPLVGAALTALLALVVASILHPLSGLVLAGVVLAACAVAWWDYRVELSTQRHTLRARAAVNREAQLITTNLTAVQAISLGQRLLARLDHAGEAAQRAVGRGARGRALGTGLTTVIAGLGVVAMALVAQAAVLHREVAAPIAALLVLGPLALTVVLGELPDAVGAAARGVQARDRLDELVGQEPAVHDASPHATGEPAAASGMRLRDIQASWTGVHDDLRLDELTLRPGERVSVSGPNGAGKSTLLAVLARHLDASSGSYEFGGRNTRDQSLYAVRSRIAVVDDEPHVFRGSVRANLLLAQPGAGDAAVAGALVDAGLGRWLASLPRGLDTELGDGRAISGGERTRLAIARAVLANRPVLLLDEPVAHLDGPTARTVLADLRAATAGATMVAVSHQAVTELAPDRALALAPDAAAVLEPAEAGAAGTASGSTVSPW
ncbi:thiol reductant ABC exporter subunit CydC [Flexivirga caeni]|uniref:Thiol reductant ABC exporter subunit CydC n=1 Tax=Flexivirga caeni TaxID=2294115 RepID=A0A3M9MIY8_9MICO|nr:thiol reductant ABC exporter subunit CydC [Flexivirga caeni]RNI25466.1 thiol reductant ABC exporter subunit CydC [Flexivirga caeni]